MTCGFFHVQRSRLSLWGGGIAELAQNQEASEPAPVNLKNSAEKPEVPSRAWAVQASRSESVSVSLRPAAQAPLPLTVTLRVI